MTAKAAAADALANLPEDASFDEIIERLYLIRKIQAGIAQADAGEVVDHEEVKRRFLGQRRHMTRIVWTAQSIADLESIRDYIARNAPRTAEAYVERLLHATDRLAAFPYSGEVVAELGVESIRQVLHGNYRLIYRVGEGLVEVLTVWHAARLLDPSLLGDG